MAEALHVPSEALGINWSFWGVRFQWMIGIVALSSVHLLVLAVRVEKSGAVIHKALSGVFVNAYVVSQHNGSSQGHK